MFTFTTQNFLPLNKIAVTAGGAILNLLIASNASAFTFTKIADTSEFDLFPIPPAINDQGAVVFSVNDSQNESIVLFLSAEAEINPISNIEDISNTTLKTLAINNNNTVLYSFVTLEIASIITVDDGEINILAETNSAFVSFGDNIDINNQDIVVFPAQLETGELGIYVNQDGINTPIFGPFEDLSPFPASGASINDNNIATFSLESLLIPSGIFTVDIDNEITTRLVEQPESFELIQISPTLNNDGTIIFSGRPTGEPYNEALFINSNEETSFIIESNITGSGQPILGSESPFAFFGSPTINDQGNIAFLGTLSLLDGISTEGIFTGPDLINDKVIASGDMLLGSEVINLSFSRHGLNNLDQIVFYAQLEDGTAGIFLADPDVESVPEPTNLLSLFVFSAFGTASILRRKHQ